MELATAIRLATRVQQNHRLRAGPKRFGLNGWINLEQSVFNVASAMCETYATKGGGYWEFYQVHGTQVFYVAPRMPEEKVKCVMQSNGWDGELSPEAFGIVCTLYCYSHLSGLAESRGDQSLTQRFANHYHALRDYVLELPHQEAAAIIAALD